MVGYFSSIFSVRWLVSLLCVPWLMVWFQPAVVGRLNSILVYDGLLICCACVPWMKSWFLQLLVI